jgi:hypothetical protein
MLVRSGLPLLAALVACWISGRSLPTHRRAVMLMMMAPVLLAVTFEEYSEGSWGVRSGDDLTTVFNARVIDRLPVSVFDLVLVLAVMTAIVTLRPATFWSGVRGWPGALRWMLALAALAVVYGAARGAARMREDGSYESFHLLREARPLAVALASLVLVAALASRDRTLLRPCGHAIFAGVLGRAVVGTIRHASGEGRWYHGDRMVFFDATDSLLFLAALAAVVTVVIRSPRCSTVAVAAVAAAPLLYGFVFSYRRSVWLGAAAALLVVVILEHGTLLARLRVTIGVTLVALMVGGVVLIQVDSSFLASRVRSVVDLDGEASNAFRVHDLRNGRHDIAAHRGLGAGFGGRAEVVSTSPDQAEFIAHVSRLNHNSAIYLVMKMGVAGGGAWLVLLLVTTGRAVIRRHDPSPAQRRAAHVITPTLIAAGITSMFLPLVYNVRPMLLWGVAAGIIWAVGPADSRGGGSQQAPSSALADRSPPADVPMAV